MRSLYFRVFLITLAVVLVSSLLGFLCSNWYYHAKLKPFNDAKLTRIADEMKRYVEARPDELESYLRSAAALGYEVMVTDGAGGERFYGHDFRERNLDPAAVAGVLAGQTYHGVADFPNKPFISGFFDNTLSNTVGLPLDVGGRRYGLFLRPDVVLQFGELRSFFAAIALLTVLFSVLLFLVSTRYLVQPIRRLTEATKRIARGQYELGLPDRRKDEIGQLAAHFRRMSGELERIERARQQFVADVSHEIQTPLTSIRGFAAALSDPALPDAARAEYVSVIAEESERLSKLSRQLLALSSLEQAADGLNRRPVRLRAQLRQALQVLEWQWRDKELAVTLGVPEDLVVSGDELLLDQVWMNLLSNAIKHTPPGGQIEIVGELRGGEAAIVVSDTGEGIAAEHLSRLFDRFYRADASRERASGGAGLGLAIVKRIVLLHGGEIEAANRPGGGSAFTVRLPQA